MSGSIPFARTFFVCFVDFVVEIFAARYADLRVRNTRANWRLEAGANWDTLAAPKMLCGGTVSDGRAQDPGRR